MHSVGIASGFSLLFSHISSSRFIHIEHFVSPIAPRHYCKGSDAEVQARLGEPETEEVETATKTSCQ